MKVEQHELLEVANNHSGMPETSLGNRGVVYILETRPGNYEWLETVTRFRDVVTLVREDGSQTNLPIWELRNPINMDRLTDQEALILAKYGMPMFPAQMMLDFFV